MRILLVNQPWPVLGGSETYLVTVASELQKLGHDVWIYAPAEGEAARLAREHGSRVVSSSGALPREPQVVLSQDAESCAKMAKRYPDSVRVYVAHSGPFLPQMPPQVLGAYHAIVTMNEPMSRLAKSLAAPGEVVRLRQPVALERFDGRAEPAAELRRVLLLGNHWRPGTRDHDVVAESCARLGLELRVVGKHGRVSLAPEVEIADADAVVGIGRCVVEAMASQRAAYVFGDRGVDGWVTPQSYEAIEARGFAGGATGAVVDVDRLCEDLRRYDSEMGHNNRHLAVRHHSARLHAADLVDLMERLEPTPVPDPAPLESVARMVRVQWELGNRLGLAEGESAFLREENRRLLDEVDRLTREAHRISTEREALRLEFDAVVQGRRYRLAQLLAKPLDALRTLRARDRRR